MIKDLEVMTKYEFNLQCIKDLLKCTSQKI